MLIDRLRTTATGIIITADGPVRFNKFMFEFSRFFAARRHEETVDLSSLSVSVVSNMIRIIYGERIVVKTDYLQYLSFASLLEHTELIDLFRDALIKSVGNTDLESIEFTEDLGKISTYFSDSNAKSVIIHTDGMFNVHDDVLSLFSIDDRFYQGDADGFKYYSFDHIDCIEEYFRLIYLNKDPIEIDKKKYAKVHGLLGKVSL